MSTDFDMDHRSGDGTRQAGAIGIVKVWSGRAAGRPDRCPDAAKAPRRVPSREQVGRRIPIPTLWNQLAGTGSGLISSQIAVDCQSSPHRIFRYTRVYPRIRRADEYLRWISSSHCLWATEGKVGRNTCSDPPTRPGVNNCQRPAAR